MASQLTLGTLMQKKRLQDHGLLSKIVTSLPLQYRPCFKPPWFDNFRWDSSAMSSDHSIDVIPDSKLPLPQDRVFDTKTRKTCQGSMISSLVAKQGQLPHQN